MPLFRALTKNMAASYFGESALRFCNGSYTSVCLYSVMGWNIVKRNAGSLIDDVRRDIAINFMLTWHKLSFLIGQFELEV